MKTLVRTNRNLLPQFPSVDDFFMGDFFDRSLLRAADRQFSVPSVNIKETDNSYEMEIAAPGFDKNNFKVELENDTLIISAQKETNKENKDDKGNYTRKEFNYESFQRSFQLPERIAEKDHISAKYSSGILHVTVPKSSDSNAKLSKQIEVA